LLQIVTVALGSPLGREVAPRELGAVLATWFSSRAGVTAEESRILIACGAGAGLAAVYNVPLTGAVFILEVLLGTAPRALGPAVITSVVATIVAWIGLGDVPQYLVPPLEISRSRLAWSIVAGPVFGVAAYGFRAVIKEWRSIFQADELRPWMTVRIDRLDGLRLQESCERLLRVGIPILPILAAQAIPHRCEPHS
jgi:H+/Cl- antiporter ClcA